MNEIGNEVARRTPVSIVCVFNAPDVLASCLNRSIDEGRSGASMTELITVDNRDKKFATAGAALNHGAAQAHNDVVVFVHQDVYLHSLPELERAAYELLTAPQIGVMGAVGIDGAGGREPREVVSARAEVASPYSDDVYVAMPGREAHHGELQS